MPFSPPIRCRATDTTLTAVELWFPDGDENAPSAPFLVRGGISWPEHVDETTKRADGFAVVLAYNLARDMAYVFSECQFVTVRHVISPETREVLYEGLIAWLRAAWNAYLCDTYYQHQHVALCENWVRQARREPEIQPDPRFVACDPPWGDVRQGESMLWDWLTRRQLAIPAGGKLSMVLRTHNRGNDPVLPPALHATVCALHGISRNLEQAREAVRNPQRIVDQVTNPLMVEHPRDWRGNK